MLISARYLHRRFQSVYSPEPNMLCLSPPQTLDYDENLLPHAEECLAHVRLLELFVRARERTRRWAEDNSISPDEAWVFYVNRAVHRFGDWIEASFHMDLSLSLPPLDVLMIWHALLQCPHEWKKFSTELQLELKHWHWPSLVSNS